MSAMAAYEKAQVELDRATGLLLDHAGILISDAERGEVTRLPNVPFVQRRERERAVERERGADARRLVLEPVVRRALQDLPEPLHVAQQHRLIEAHLLFFGLQFRDPDEPRPDSLLPARYIRVQVASPPPKRIDGTTWAEGLMADVSARNYPALRLLQQAGFAFCGFNDRCYPNGEVALFFSCRLP